MRDCVLTHVCARARLWQTPQGGKVPHSALPSPKRLVSISQDELDQLRAAHAAHTALQKEHEIIKQQLAEMLGHTTYMTDEESDVETEDFRDLRFSPAHRNRQPKRQRPSFGTPGMMPSTKQGADILARGADFMRQLREERQNKRPGVELGAKAEDDSSAGAEKVLGEVEEDAVVLESSRRYGHHVLTLIHGWANYSKSKLNGTLSWLTRKSREARGMSVAAEEDHARVCQAAVANMDRYFDALMRTRGTRGKEAQQTRDSVMKAMVPVDVSQQRDSLAYACTFNVHRRVIVKAAEA